MKPSQKNRIRSFLRDERGQAMTEYMIITASMAVLAMYLYSPYNPLFDAVRQLFQNIFGMLVMIGP